MIAFDAMRSSDGSAHPASNSVAVQVADAPESAVVRNCSRLGRSANPPGFSFGDWLRDRRSR
jgi:hypothetical protein